MTPGAEGGVNDGRQVASSGVLVSSFIAFDLPASMLPAVEQGEPSRLGFRKHDVDQGTVRMGECERIPLA